MEHELRDDAMEDAVFVADGLAVATNVLAGAQLPEVFACLRASELLSVRVPQEAELRA